MTSLTHSAFDAMSDRGTSAVAQSHSADTAAARKRGSTRRADRLEYRLIFALAFIVFFVVAIAARIMPRAWRERVLGLPHRGGIVSDARSMVTSSIPFAFMA
ncbi:MAG: hypothetical protein WCH83_04655 [Alphaproteobacteria bacterium]|jgi:hypothetical protein